MNLSKVLDRATGLLSGGRNIYVARRLGRTIRKIARDISLQQDVPREEKMKAIEHRFEIMGKLELLHNEFARAYGRGEFDKLGDEVKEQLKSSFDSLMDVVDNAIAGFEEVSEVSLR